MFRKLIIAAAAMLLTLGAFAADEPEKPWKYVNAKDLRIINKGFNDTERDFSPHILRIVYAHRCGTVSSARRA